MNEQPMIRISRSNEIKNDLDQAILWLNNLHFEAGVLVMVNYFVSGPGSNIDAVLALGLRSGTGKNYYKVISTTKKELVWGVFFDINDIPDVSTLDHEEVFLYHDSRLNIWFLIYNKDGIRTFTEISDIPQTFINLADGTTWVSNESRQVGRLNDIANLYNKEEIDRLIDYARDNPKYVQFDRLTEEQISQIKGEKGDQGDKGERGDRGLQGERGIQGYNGSIDNFIVLSQAEYDALEYLDPYKFYFTYEDDEQGGGGGSESDFYAYVQEQILYIYATVNNHVLDVSPAYSNYNSNTHTIEFTTTSSLIPSPVFSPGEGTYDGAKDIIITCPDNEASIYYTTDLSDPTEDSIPYDGPISLDQSAVIKARAYKSGFLASRIVEAIYTLNFTATVDAPVIDHNSGSYPEAFNITITCPTEDATIRYTRDGSEPNSSSSIYIPNSALRIEGHQTTIRVRAFKPYMNPSITITKTYIIGSVTPVSNPVISPSGGTYTSPQDITITCPTSGVTIRYTLDGSDPDENSTQFTVPFTISESKTVKAKAYRSDMEPSNIVTQSYVISNVTPPPEPPDDGDDETGVTGTTLNNFNGTATLNGSSGNINTYTLYTSSAHVDNHTLIIP